MNALVKKEIRLLLPSWIVAMLLAMVQGITRPYDFYVASLLFFGLTIMALTTIGRETSLNTFSSLLAQPAERIRIWKTKLSILAVGFVTVFAVWLAAFGIAFVTSQVDANDRDNSYNLFITISLIAAATFTGGLWTTLLLRQLAGAFWLTLLVPAVLSGVAGAFSAQTESDNLVIAVLSVVIAVYSVGGFLFARWLFFRAQDVGWSGGNIVLPEWKFFAHSENAVSLRNRKPLFALVKKEFQLQQISLFGAAGILVLHFGIILLRKYHHFNKDSAGEVLTPIFWMVWLVLAPVIGSMAVAEERRLGVMEGQLCLPVSRRIQFTVKAVFTLGLGIFLGGVMPMLLEHLAASLGTQNLMFVRPGDNSGIDFFWLSFFVVSSAAWLALLGFFGSSLSRSFLQAVGFGIATFFISTALVSIGGREFFQGFISVHSALPVVVAIPTIIITMLWLAYLNFKNFHPGWPLWRRNLLGFTGAFVFVIAVSTALYNRVWEVFEPAEPAHGPAELFLSNPPVLRADFSNNLLVRLPDGSVWFEYLDYGHPYYNDSSRIRWLLRFLVDPLPKISGAKRYIAGSNWVSATVRHVDFELSEKDNPPQGSMHVSGYLDTVGVQADGTLWISDASKSGAWTGDKVNRFGDGTNWQQLVRAQYEVLLLKNDGTLWSWGTFHFDWSQWQTDWPSLRACPLHQVGIGSDWKEIRSTWRLLARKSDNSVWTVGWDDKSGKDDLQRDKNLDQASFQTLSQSGDGETAYVRLDGTLWMSWMYQQNRTNSYSGFVQVGTETNWATVALNWQKMVALKSDGSLWQWQFVNPWDLSQKQIILAAKQPAVRLGIHSDWVAIASTWQDTFALAADGGLWLWPNREQYEQSTLLKLPKQPKFLGNIFGKSN
jgi:ABC-type Na+ efflux pump permease subunit